MPSNYPGSLDAFATLTDNVSPANAVQMNNVQDSIAALERYGHPVYNAKTYGGAKGDGTTDDTTAIQTCLDAARTAGGGLVFLPPGIYMVHAAAHPNGTWNTALTIGNNVMLRGAGRDTSTIKLMAGGGNTLYNQAAVITNHVIAPGAAPEDAVTIEDLTIDGNGGAQNTAICDRQMGIFFNRARNCHVSRVKVINVLGSNAGGNGPNLTLGEGMGYEAQLSMDIWYTNCSYFGNMGNARSAATINTPTAGGAGGFDASQSTNVYYVNCVASNSAQAHGFSHWSSQGMAYSNCRAYLNRWYGFNSEYGTYGTADVQYENCLSGGVFLTTTGGVIPPFTSGQSLGNGSWGWRLNGALRVFCSNCISESNGDSGIYADTNSTGRWSGGASLTNTNYGINMNDVATAAGWRFRDIMLAGNVSNGLVVGGVAKLGNGIGWVANTPAVPASGTALTNQIGFDVMVYINGGTVSAFTIGGYTAQPTGQTATPAVVRLPAGSTIMLTYTVAPTWQWFAD